MARGVRTSKYSRRTSSGGKRSRAVIVIATVAAFLVLCFVVSVAVGLSLGKQADEYASSHRYDLEVEEYYSGNKRVKAVDAYVFYADSSIKSYILNGVTDFSVALRGSEGELNFSSSIIPAEEGEVQRPDLRELVDSIHSQGGYVCAYFYVVSMNIEDKYQRELHKAYEIALVNEAAESGVDEIMLVGIDTSDAGIEEAHRFVSDMAFAAEGASLGVLIPPEIFKLTEEGAYNAAIIRSVCDFVALDLRGVSCDEPEGADEETEGQLSSVLAEMEFYVRSYNMRVVFSKENSALYDSAKKMGAVSIQIIEE